MTMITTGVGYLFAIFLVLLVAVGSNQPVETPRRDLFLAILYPMKYVGQHYVSLLLQSVAF
jgi:hypothetical protein